MRLVGAGGLAARQGFSRYSYGCFFMFVVMSLSKFVLFIVLLVCLFVLLLLLLLLLLVLFGF